MLNVNNDHYHRKSKHVKSLMNFIKHHYVTAKMTELIQQMTEHEMHELEQQSVTANSEMVICIKKQEQLQMINVRLNVL